METPKLFEVAASLSLLAASIGGVTVPETVQIQPLTARAAIGMPLGILRRKSEIPAEIELVVNPFTPQTFGTQKGKVKQGRQNLRFRNSNYRIDIRPDLYA